MIKHALLLIVTAGAILVACGPAPKTEKEICGAQGCDSCVGFSCSRLPDGGVP